MLKPLCEFRYRILLVPYIIVSPRRSTINICGKNDEYLHKLMFLTTATRFNSSRDAAASRNPSN